MNSRRLFLRAPSELGGPGRAFSGDAARPCHARSICRQTDAVFARLRARLTRGHDTGFPKSYAKLRRRRAAERRPGATKRPDGHVGLREALREAALLLFQFLVAMTLVGLDLLPVAKLKETESFSRPCKLHKVCDRL